jgi:hypothetical protein
MKLQSRRLNLITGHSLKMFHDVIHYVVMNLFFKYDKKVDFGTQCTSFTSYFISGLYTLKRSTKPFYSLRLLKIKIEINLFFPFVVSILKEKFIYSTVTRCFD